MNLQNQKTFAPVAVFTYKRLDTLKVSINALKKCRHATDTVLYVFSDGPKKESDLDAIKKVRDFINTIDGFKNVITKFSEVNKGLANSIIGGVTNIINEHQSIIVLEDDLIPSLNFLSYMNCALANYQDNTKVYSIAGYTPPIKLKKQYDYDNYFTLRSSSWGWATWKDRWQGVDWDVLDYANFKKDKLSQKRFNKMGSDLTKMLSDQKKGKINSWAIRWCYHQFKTNQLTVYPIISKINNIGFGANATHTAGDDKRYKTPLDNTENHEFEFNPIPVLDAFFIKQFTIPYSLKTRFYYKLKKLLKV